MLSEAKTSRIRWAFVPRAPLNKEKFFAMLAKDPSYLSFLFRLLFWPRECGSTCPLSFLAYAVIPGTFQVWVSATSFLGPFKGLPPGTVESIECPPGSSPYAGLFVTWPHSSAFSSLSATEQSRKLTRVLLFFWGGDKVSYFEFNLVSNWILCRFLLGFQMFSTKQSES